MENEKLAFVASVLGILLVVVLSNIGPLIKPEIDDIEDMERLTIAERIHLRAKIGEVKEYGGGHTKLVVHNPEDDSFKTAVFIPKYANNGQVPKAGMCIDIVGDIEFYNGAKELVPERPGDYFIFVC